MRRGLKPIGRRVQFKFLLTEEERRRLHELAVAVGLSDSDYLRLHINDEYNDKLAKPKR